MAWRPPYQPQFGHTTWGSLARWHCGHSLRGGGPRRHAEARRLRLFALEVFFLGTAIGGAEIVDPRWAALDVLRGDPGDAD